MEMSNARRFYALLLVFALSLAFVGCGGGGYSGGGGGGTVANLSVTVDDCQTVSDGAGGQIICVDFTVNGEVGQAFILAYEFFLDAGTPGQLDGESTFAMTEITAAQETQFGVTSDSSLAAMPAGATTVSGRFCWDPGADLGFVGATDICISLDIEAGAGSPAGQTVSDDLCCGLSYEGGVMSVVPVLPPDPTGDSLVADHTAHAVGNGDSVVIAGGIDQSTSARARIERYQFDLSADPATGTIPFATSAVPSRDDAASAFFYGPGNVVQVLVCGGNSAGDGTERNSSDIYTFSPESADPGPDMSAARWDHTATWLPDNRVLVVGGGTSIVEMFDPATGLFTNVASLADDRSRHTASLLPDGRVLVAGGFESAGTALAAQIYSPDYQNRTGAGTWTTEAVVDRYDHTATMLVSGDCYLIGGQKVSDDSVLDQAVAYRSFASGQPPFQHPAGFSSPIPFTASFNTDQMVEGRTQHAASRLGDGSILVTGGFDGMLPLPGLTLDTAEIFLPIGFSFNAPTLDELGAFSSTNSQMASARARHTQNTTSTGSAIAVGGVIAHGPPPILVPADDLVESYRFNNTAPSVSNFVVDSSDLASVHVTFDIADSEGDKAFVFLRYSTDGGTTFSFATLVNYEDASNIDTSSGSATLSWDATTDGLSSGASVMIEIIPVGGVFGSAQQATVTL